jgi:WD40 repeat protein
VRLWDAHTGQQIGPALQHQDLVSGAQLSRDDGRILTSSWDKTARVWLLNADLDFPAEYGDSGCRLPRAVSTISLPIK